MKDTLRMIKESGISNKNTNRKHLGRPDNNDMNPVSLISLRKMLMHYESIGDVDVVTVLKQKINSLLLKINTPTRSTGIEIVGRYETFLVCENDTILCAEDGDYLIL